MNTNAVTISPKFQVVIPKEIREAMHFHPGQKLQAIPFGNGLMLVPMMTVEESFGFLKDRGIDTAIERDEIDRV